MFLLQQMKCAVDALALLALTLYPGMFQRYVSRVRLLIKNRIKDGEKKNN